MYINCISCGHKFDIGKSYDDYEGPVRCPTCRAMLTIRTEDGSIRAVFPGLVQPAAAQRPQHAQQPQQAQQPQYAPQPQYAQQPQYIQQPQPQAQAPAQVQDAVPADDHHESIEVDFNPVRRNAA